MDLSIAHALCTIIRKLKATVLLRHWWKFDSCVVVYLLRCITQEGGNLIKSLQELHFVT